MYSLVLIPCVRMLSHTSVLARITPVLLVSFLTRACCRALFSYIFCVCGTYLIPVSNLCSSLLRTRLLLCLVLVFLSRARMLCLVVSCLFIFHTCARPHIDACRHCTNLCSSSSSNAPAAVSCSRISSVR